MTEPVQEHPNDDPFRPVRVTLSPAAQKLDDHLAASITALTQTRERIAPMRGMQRLANLAPTILSGLDAKADATADKLLAQKARAETAIGQYDGLADSLGKVADDVTAALGQLTNDPTQVSGA